MGSGKGKTRRAQSVVAQPLDVQQPKAPESAIKEVTSRDFSSVVLESDSPVLVDCGSPMCGPCKALRPVLEKIARKGSDVKIVYFDVHANSELAYSYKIWTIPMMVLFKNGEEVKRLKGIMPQAEIEAEMAALAAS
jgi:thioredoxin 1